ncbi:MAG: hypothetical protein IPM34_10600 [Saprospiraceae bacterium]|nr:hypothetical protein [Saprospiraceae bacterium]
MKVTRGNLKKLEDLCKALQYTVRYEQGHFQSGYCRVESKKVLVINKFFDIEGRMNCLLDLIPELESDRDSLSEEEKNLYDKAVSLRSLQETEA